MSPSLVAMALSAAQNNNQQTKGANKRKDGDDSVGRQQLIQEERSMPTEVGNQQALMVPLPMEATGQEKEEQKEEVVELVLEEEEDSDDLSSVELFFLVQQFVVPVQHEKKMSFNSLTTIRFRQE
jgi:hypothetical protein